MRIRFFIILAISAIICRAADFGDISIERLPQLHSTYLPYGYQTNTYRLQNKGDKPASITIREQTNADSTNYSRTRSMDLAPMTTAYLSLYSPQFDHEYFYMRDAFCDIIINGKQQKLPPDLLRFHAPSGSLHRQQVAGLASPSIPVNDYKTLLDFTHEHEESLTGAASPVEQWPSHVREYIGFSHIWISSEDRIKPEVRQALDDFVHLGGTLLVIVPPEAPWPLANVPEPANCHVNKQGFGKIVTLRPINQQNKAALQMIIQKLNAEDRARRHMIFNENERVKHPALEQLANFNLTTSDIRHLEFPDSLLAIPPHTIPLLTLFLVMTVFAIIIGPLNYWYLHKKGKQLLLIFTTPVISIVFCVFVFLFITLYEGWQSHGAACGFTLLDQTEHRADTFAKVVMDAAIRPAGGFKFSADDLVSFNGDGTIEVLDAPGQTIDSSVMKPRVPLNYLVSRTEPHREQLDISFSGNMATVTNGLGTAVESLVIISHDNLVFQFHEIDPLPPGETIRLRGKPNIHKPSIPPINHLFTMVTKDAQSNFTNIPNWLHKGQYAVKVNEPLFYSIGMKPDSLKATHFIIGNF